jgi:hypothetical protein
MATKSRRIVFYAREDLVDFLQRKTIETGYSTGEIVRQAVRLAQYAELASEKGALARVLGGTR